VTLTSGVARGFYIPRLRRFTANYLFWSRTHWHPHGFGIQTHSPFN